MQAEPSKCTKCGEIKPLAEFSKDKTRSSGFYPSCKACKNSYYRENSKEILKQYKTYRNLNRDKIREQSKRCNERCFFRLTAENLRGRANDPRSAKKVDLARLWKKQRGQCAISGRRLNRENASLDHIIPITKGGGSHIENLQWLHKDVNHAKRDLLQTDFLQLCREIVTYQHSKGKAGSMQPAELGTFYGKHNFNAHHDNQGSTDAARKQPHLHQTG